MRRFRGDNLRSKKQKIRQMFEFRGGHGNLVQLIHGREQFKTFDEVTKLGKQRSDKLR